MAKTETAGVAKGVHALTARTQCGRILESVTENQDRFLVSKRGEAKAVILSVEDYLRNIVQQPESLHKLQDAAATAGTDRLTMEEIDAEIAAHRRGL